MTRSRNVLLLATLCCGPALILCSIIAPGFGLKRANAQEKKGVWRFDHVEFHRGYSLRNADKPKPVQPATPSGGLTIKDYKAATRAFETTLDTYWYTHQATLGVVAPEQVADGQEITVAATHTSAFTLKEDSGSSRPYVSVRIGLPEGDRKETVEKLQPGPHTLSATKSLKVRLGDRKDSVLGYSTDKGVTYAKFGVDARTSLSNQILYTVYWFYRFDSDATSNPTAPPPGNLPDHVRQRLEELRQAAKTNKWTFEVGHTSAADRNLLFLAATRLPAGLDLPKVAGQQNTVGAQWWKADRTTRDAFNKKHPGVLPGLKVEPREQAGTYAQKSRFDWRDYNVVPAIRDQQTCGSCWSFAALGAFESNYKIRNNESLDLSEQQILDCANSGTCDGGWFQKVFEHLVQRGVGVEPAYAYKNAQGTCKTISSPHKAVSWGFVDPKGGMPGVAAMKEALCKHGPLAVSVNATEAFQHYTKGVFNEFASGNTNHAVIIVGWDDSKGKNGAWAMRNSWSPNWGENGYMWIEYGCNNIGAHAAWVEAQSKHYAVMTLLANHYRVRSGEEVLAPIYLLNPTSVKNMNWTLAYQPGVAGLDQRVVQGNLPLTLFEVNPREAGLVRMGFAQTTPIDKTNGTVAVLRFRAAGAPGTRTLLTLAVSKINDPAGKELPIKLMHGSIEIVKDHIQIPKGSCTGREVLGIEDARCALQMSVGNRPKAANMDIDNDGDVTSRDAAIIIQRVLEQVRTGS